MGVIAQHFRKAMTYRSKRGVRGPATINLTGTQYGTMPAWTPKSALWGIEWSATANANGTTQYIADSAGAAFIALVASNRLQVRLVDALGGNKDIIPVTVFSTGSNISGRLVVYADKAEVHLAGTVTTVAGDFSNPVNNTFSAVAGSTVGGNGLVGSPSYLRFIDLSPLQSVRAMAGDGSSRYAAISEIALPGDFEVDIWWQRLDVSGTGTSALLGATTSGDNWIAAVDSAHASVANRLELKIGGVVIATTIPEVAQGDSVRITASRTSGISSIAVNGVTKTSGSMPATWTITRILNGGSTYGRGAIWVKITDKTTGKVYTYNNANDTGNLLENSSKVDRIGPELTGGNLSGFTTSVTGGSVVVVGNTITSTATGKGALFTLQPNALYEVAVSGSTTAGLSVNSSNGPVDNVTTRTEFGAGFGTFTVKTSATERYLYLRNVNAGTTTISNISIRRIYALKTAEGAELWDGTLTPNGSCSVSGRTITATGNSWYYGSAKVITGAAGKHYFVTATVKTKRVTTAGTAWALKAWDRINGYAQVANAVGAVGASDGTTTLSFYVRSPSSELLLGIHSGSTPMAGDVMEVLDFSFREVTHGLWYQSGAVMTDAAANAARAYLPPINRTYDFADSIQTLPALSPLNNVRAMAGDGSSRYAAIPQITLTGDFEIEFWYIRKDSAAGNQFITIVGENDPVNSAVLIYDSTHPTNPNVLQIRVEDAGYNIAGALDGVAQDQHVKIRIARLSGTSQLYIDDVLKSSIATPGTLELNTIGRYDSIRADGYLNTPFSGMKITDLTNNNTWEYNNKDDSGNVLTNLSNVDRLGPNQSRSGSVSTKWSEPSPGVFRRAGQPGWAALPIIGAGGVTSGAVVEATLTIKRLSGVNTITAITRDYTDTTNKNIALVEGKNTVRMQVYPDAAAGGGWMLRVDSDTTDFEVSDISWRRIYSLATAEGAEVTNAPALGAWKKSGDHYTLAGDGTFQGMTIAGLSASKTYRLRCTVHSLSGGTLKAFINTADYGLVLGDNTHYFTGATSLQFVRWNGTITTDITYDLVEVTHGIWHEGATAMTNAAANAARTYLPALPKRLAGSTDVPDNNGQNPVVWTGLTADNIIEGELA